ncbi:hypothetical protein BT93_L0034 [Corymbia citriodora subsp. variegata]|uniref:Uncharacterized protein n=1 Tax=Corymbia citriodora subsp. variegata TaxID=360336 RepID=A0A8T0CQX2_CORYI|nr:hypothetical protein BT93_L0034 [Corymbia citriodora subsp. variegata]
MTSSAVLDFESDRSPTSESEDVDSSAPPEQRIVVANHLPLQAHQDKQTGKWSFEWDRDCLVFQLKDGLRPDIVYIGSLKADIDIADQEEVSHLLFEKFQCVPTFLSPDMQNKFYHGFCKHYLWPLFHHMLPMSPSQGAQFCRQQWHAYVSANKVFADKIMEVINPEEDYVWIHDYHLMVLPTFLRKKFHKIKIGFSLHSPFPPSEIYRTIPVRDEILKALLNCDLIGFYTFDYAQHFLSCCSRMLGLNYKSKRGYIKLDYNGRIVRVKILPGGIHMGQFQSVLSLESTIKRVKELKEQYKGRTMILGVDDLDMFKGVDLKFLAMGQLLEVQPELRGRVVLVQITNPARSSGKDVQAVQKETDLVANEINRKYGKPGYEPIVYIKGPVTTQEKAAYYSIAECVVVNAIRDGMNVVPYKYTVCRQGTPALDKALETDESSSPRKSMIIVSEFVGCSRSLSGAIRVNPWNIDSVADAMNSAVTISDLEKHLRHDKHYKYISSHDVVYWAQSFDQDLERACRENYPKSCCGLGFGLGFRVVALGPDFRKLPVDPVASAYRNTTNRLILLDYDGTLLPKASIDKRPSSEVISVLNHLCRDPDNVVFIVSGRGKDSLGAWFSPCEKLGIAAEHGYFKRWTGDSNWELCRLTMHFDWKRIAEPVMEQYMKTTDGSFIETKESALVWHHQDADSHFGSFQAKELLDHLESVLTNEPVVVKRGQHIIEVKPQGVNKGTVVENLVSAMRSRGTSLDFLLCIGDDLSDEDMFETIDRSVSNPSLPSTAEVFTCTIGQKPSMAKYYLDDTSKVISLLQGLAAATSHPKLRCFQSS